MTTKQWLNKAYRLNQEINNLIKTKEKIMEDALSITQSYSGDVTQSTKDPHRKYDALVEINDKIDRDIDQLVDLRDEIYDVISNVEDPLYRTILTDRYVAGMTWENIAKEINYTRQHTCRLHGYALKAISNHTSKKM